MLLFVYKRLWHFRLVLFFVFVLFLEPHYSTVQYTRCSLYKCGALEYGDQWTAKEALFCAASGGGVRKRKGMMAWVSLQRGQVTSLILPLYFISGKCWVWVVAMKSNWLLYAGEASLWKKRREMGNSSRIEDCPWTAEHSSWVSLDYK